MFCDISIFAKPPYKVFRDGHMGRVSSIIRGGQIANYIGAKLNPTNGYENDVCIYVKPHVKRGDNFNFEGRPYLDIIDATDLYPLAKMRPEVPVIAISQWDYETMRSILPNKVVLIPQHHCNFERITRKREGITTVGVIGTVEAFDYLPKGLEEYLSEKGIGLLKFSKIFTRESVVDFYQKIDVQIVWRPYFNYKKHVLMNPLKLVNAASFGIPTIAYQEGAFKEMEGYYIPVRDLDGFTGQLEALEGSPQMYLDYSQKCLQKAEEYHIENIGRLYKDLCRM